MNELEVQDALDRVVKKIANGDWGETKFALITFGEGVYLCLEGYNPNTKHSDLSLWKGCCNWDGLQHPDGPDKERITSVASAEKAIALNPGMAIVQTGCIKHGDQPLLSHSDDLPFVNLSSR